MTASTSSSRGLHAALAVVGIDAMGIGIVFPVMPDLLLSLGSVNVADAALWGGLLTTLYALMQFLCAPVIGALSDRFGRRPVLVGAMLAMTVDYVILSVAGGLAILLVGRAVAGAAGGAYSAATAYVADISSPADRAARFGLVGAVFGLGFVAGPALGGAVGEWHVRAPFMVAGVLSATGFALVLFTLPESLPVERRRRFSFARANPVGALMRALRLPALRALLVVYLLLQTGVHVYPVIWAFWSKLVFGWSVGTVGITLALYGLMLAAVQGLLVRPAVSRLGETGAVMVGLVLTVFAALGFAFVSEGWIVFALIPLAALGDLAVPALTGVLSNRVGADEQGELQGVIASLTALAAVSTPPVASGLFHAFAHPEAAIQMPGFPFLFTVLVVAVGIPIAWRALRRPADASS